jgi:hypothetical protein
MEYIWKVTEGHAHSTWKGQKTIWGLVFIKSLLGKWADRYDVPTESMYN